ncbi:fibrinogen-binding adhesin SdrG C-terminal domain-containing protein [Limosilactobacillus reuteri]|uniref:fibrinogen-binding adhesin SdrG C-terminal domain-containing protein n=1 Tax=Limosilactobacillus reuteri TaxID=1598 RepID=UPI001E4B2AF6|nr:fibrinogen-binding adhesin SdrG C-terminal domain-containing protein [Limosilactobacillus reuteri]MCC4436292.1 fibrinogen-binding adhesin SdrG C-terminal domain-containing protein [Limosilactobacillus reuteri]MCC4437456.1 fibrinogen-binding adhesin SdrG C-terminal domain-containing protein [Limosilactobacillus reuteri]MCC4442424.1 fibrinogen-binding adhesin SdrG C-terminal domain-containing protein [Limosilactobacillus reuteri]MCC4444165.1 fibrinogen-binding adhesin SdrG C-terminal domain-co
MMDNYQAMNFYYGLLNLRAGFFKANLCEILMAIAQSVPDENQQSATAYHTVDEDLSKDREQLKHDQVEFGSFYEDGHILHNVKINTQSDFFLDPTREDTVKWHVSFTVAKDVRPADQFTVQLSSNLMVAPNGHPEKPVPDFSDQDGVVIAMGAYDRDKHELVYTFTNYVTEHRQIIGELEGELAIDPLTTPENEFGLECFISVDDYRKDFTIDIDYPDLANDMFLGISSRMMHFDKDQQLFEDIIYVNPAQKDLNHAYIVFNTSDLVEELSNAVVKPSTMRIEIYRNSRGLKLPQSYGVNLQRLRDISNRFPVVEGDHLVETPYTMSFADNKMRLNFGADQTNDSYIIRVVGQYNDELDGTVRLRARLFGMDQQNVYMSNSTATTATGTSMIASGHAISKEKLVEAAAITTEDLKQEEPFESSAIEGVAEDVDIPFASDNQEQFTSSQAEEEEMPIEENQEDIPINDVATEGQVEPQEDFPQSAVSVPDDAAVEEESDSSAYIISFNSDDEEESTAATEQEENQAEAPTVSAAVGGDELSISFDITPQAAPAETREDLTEEIEASNGEEETSAAPLPMPGRRPPRRHSRFQNTTRSNHSLRHLRRF